MKHLLDKRDDTPLHSAVRAGNLELIIEILTGSGENELKELLSKQNQPGETALYVAAECGHVNLVKEMVKYHDSCSAGIKGRNGYDAFHIAAKQGDLAIAASIEPSMSEGALLLLLRNCNSYSPFELNEKDDEDEEAPDEDEDDDEDFFVEWHLIANEKDFLWLVKVSSIPSWSMLFMTLASVGHALFPTCPNWFSFSTLVYLLKLKPSLPLDETCPDCTLQAALAQDSSEQPDLLNRDFRYSREALSF
ncbi:hypothetical protein RJ639_017817 [Escallonia herrerae]|uniref:Uncharacterized protein n=1 Tax=Escallonia herrerae TaxID=1293975 RepID=A0AA89ALC6_9ASTE|nr:hypothetical protein RJ639_017817 [Escallonia herrerae]